MQLQNILIINIARFGDTLLVTPVIRALKELAVIEHPVDYRQATRQDAMSAISVDQVWHAVQNLLENQ
ncbi:hypothetical protein PSI15_06290 [Xenorhabdus sp. PR6a]|uniref:hypothetical protein n=1 Tax=Xenorhabdus sp. PR6a TaxID=3025877 RepID=UPI00235894DD|nr:hypothetical protein [Xenorhabdus sp. PR6a]MDC9581180.1 hypothetical protein [Xenorhabdus sp. PR6a]